MKKQLLDCVCIVEPHGSDNLSGFVSGRTYDVEQMLVESTGKVHYKLYPEVHKDYGTVVDAAVFEKYFRVKPR